MTLPPMHAGLHTADEVAACTLCEVGKQLGSDVPFEGTVVAQNLPPCVPSAGAPRAALSHVLLIDDHALFRSGMRLLLKTLDPQVEVRELARVDELAGAWGDGGGAWICLLDLDLRDSVGLGTLDLARVRLPDTPIVVVSAHEEPTLIRACIDRGATGYVPKSAPAEVLTAALGKVLRGEVYMPDVMYDPKDAGTVDAVLSRRQLEVLGGIARGLPTKSIANSLKLSEYTVKEHLEEIYRALGVHNRTAAVIKAGRMALQIHPWPP